MQPALARSLRVRTGLFDAGILTVWPGRIFFSEMSGGGRSGAKSPSSADSKPPGWYSFASRLLLDDDPRWLPLLNPAPTPTAKRARIRRRTTMTIFTADLLNGNAGGTEGTRNH